MSAPRAVIYVPDGLDAPTKMGMCTEYVTERGYALAAVVVDGEGGWDSVRALLDAGHAEVAVVAYYGDPPADRVPRTEYVMEEGPAPQAPTQRRPRLIRRDGEE